MSTLSVLTGSAGPALARAVLAVAGAPADGAEIAVRRVHHRPGADTTVSFSVRQPGAGERVVLITDADVAGFDVTAATGERLRGWVHPDDPRLPGLARALSPAVLGGWLASEVGAAPVTPELLSYRPLRRAVVRAGAAGRHFYVKLWRPERAAELVGRHRVLDAAGVGPRIAAEPEAGVLIVHDADGVTLAQRLADWNAGGEPLPEPGEVLRLLDRLPDELLRFRRRAAWSDRADFHGAAAAATLPDQAAEIAALAAHLTHVLASTPEGPPVPTHGDFYEANVLARGSVFTSVIDVDTAGPGRRVDDLACLLGHLAVLPDLSPTHYHRVPEVTYAWASEFERHCPAAELRARTAGVILSLVAGTTRPHALARLDASRAWLYRAGCA